ncbi:rho-N domain-containing protein 1 chloroplastic-like [Tripterygium wilfordii]|uniref:Rho-N domain-containing protein 1 chloroplastic-like n=1 Tax=Tripterygium wilfordii TaxID=458696 RepID=A0A7J7CXV1_TRIWF|nr:rho-N domain-containing protein 1, chloroplastic-like [Tripterygium wilfordii]KAF5738947.1 rho-N domain-containing protein 1 chloroplastic-like [Tripterygium wilfordii]
MSHAVHLIAKSIPGYGPSDGKCLPCLGVSGRVVSLSSCTFRANNIDHSQVKNRPLKCASRGASFVCTARRNPDFSRPNKGGYSRNRNRQNEERDRDSFGNVDESELLSSRNGPLLTLSNNSKYQATAVPGPREKEIVELFRKVQTQLRERAAVKEEKKIEAIQSKGKESETVNSLLKLLRKHSGEQAKRKGRSGSSEDFNLDQPEQSAYNEDKSRSFFSSTGKIESEAPKSNAVSPTRPQSIFRRKSPVPQVKYESIYPSEDTLNSTSQAMDLKRDLFEIQPEPIYDPESEPEPEIETEPESRSVFPDGDVFDKLAEDELDVDDADDDEDEEKQDPKDLSALKLLELRALAKSRGIKGYSKMKKGDLLELLS